MSLRRLSAVLAVVGMLAACGNDTTAEPPAELVDISTTLPVHRLWSAGLGGDGEILRLMLGVEGRGDTVYAAGRDGDVRAMDAATGKVRWNTDTDLALSAGPGVGDDIVVVGTSDGELVALERATGKQRWKTKVPGEILAPPLVTSERVLVRSVEGRLRAMSATDGKQLWLVEDIVPRLSLRGTATPVAADGNVADGETEEILGIHVVGAGASDLVSEAALAIEMGAFLHDLSLTVHPHPTLPEAIMEAAKHALGEAIHIVNK